MRSLVAMQYPELASLGADDATSLQAQLTLINQQIEAKNAQIAYGYAQYNQNHFGGQTPDQFSAWVGARQSELTSLQNQAGAISAKIQAAQATAQNDAAKKQSDIIIQQASPEEQIKTAQRMAFLSPIIRGPDYGMKTNSRNTFYGRDSGLGLGLDIMDAIIKGVQKSAPTAFKDVKLSVPDSLKQDLPAVGGFKLPAPLANIFKGLGKVGTAVYTEAKNQKKPASAPAPSAPSRSGPPASASIMSNPWVIGGAAAVGFVVIKRLLGGKK